MARLPVLRTFSAVRCGFSIVEIARGDVAAEFREAERNRFTKAHSSPGDERYPPAKIK